MLFSACLLAASAIPAAELKNWGKSVLVERERAEEAVREREVKTQEAEDRAAHVAAELQKDRAAWKEEEEQLEEDEVFAEASACALAPAQLYTHTSLMATPDSPLCGPYL